MRLLFLLGSGVSRPACIPGVCGITRKVLSGDGVVLRTDGVFGSSHLKPTDPGFERLRRPAQEAITLIQRLSALARDYYGALEPDGVLEPDYEELAFLAGEIQHAIDRSRENPALLPLLRKLAGGPGSRSLCRLARQAEQARNYIRDVTREMLDRQPAGTDHLAALIDACRDVKTVDFFTLNHDTLLEGVLRGSGIAFADGFEREYGDLRIWSDTFASTVRLFKLHGSIDWWAFRLPSEEWRGFVTARVTNGDPAHACGPDGAFLEPPHDMRPVFLTGTFDKILGYEGFIFPDQHFRFQEALRESSRLVVIGYGFRDRAINSRLIAWLARSRDNRMIVVHPDPEDLGLRQARKAIRNHWQTWRREGRMRAVYRQIEDTRWDDIDRALSK